MFYMNVTSSIGFKFKGLENVRVKQFLIGFSTYNDRFIEKNMYCQLGHPDRL